MEDKIVNERDTDILRTMIKNRVCPKCGGTIHTFKTGICTMCGAKWETNYLDSGFESIMSKLDNYSFDLNETTIYLCSLSSYSEKLYSMLKTFKAQDRVKEKLDIINGKLFNGIKLSEEEDSLLRYSLFGGISPDSELNVLSVINSIFRNNMIVSYDTFKQVMTFFIQTLISRSYGNIVNNYNPIVNIFYFDGENKNSLGITHDIFRININEDIIAKLYNDGNIEAFTTIFHELAHIEQMVYMKYGYISDRIIDYIKDDVIYKTIHEDNYINYYKENYDVISFEKDAEIIGTTTAVKWLNEANIKLKDNIQVILNNHVNNELEKRMIRNRTVNGKVYDIDELFEKCIMLHPEYLKSYPQLNIEYVREGDYVFKRSTSQLYELLNLYKEDNNTSKYINKLIEANENSDVKKH